MSNRQVNMNSNMGTGGSGGSGLYSSSGMSSWQRHRWAWVTGAGVAAVAGYMYWNRAHAHPVLSPETRASIRHDMDEAKAAGERALEKGKEAASNIGRKVRDKGLRQDEGTRG